MARRELTLKDLNNFSTDKRTLVLCFLYHLHRADQTIFDYHESFYQKIESKLEFGHLTCEDGTEEILLCFPKGKLRLTREDVDFMERKRYINMLVRRPES